MNCIETSAIYSENDDIAESEKRSYTRQVIQQRAPFSVQAPPPRRATLVPSLKLLGYALASFAQGEHVGRTL